MSFDYLGDSITNALSDIVCAAAGFLLATKLGPLRTVALLIAIELALLWLIRANLTLNAIMLIYPIDALKAWQSAGHLPA